MAQITYDVLQKPLEVRLLEAACIYWEVESEFFKKDGDRTNKRRLLFYLLYKDCDMSYDAIAKRFGCHRRNVEKHIEICEATQHIYSQLGRNMAAIREIAGKLDAKIVVTEVKLL